MNTTTLERTREDRPSERFTPFTSLSIDVAAQRSAYRERARELEREGVGERAKERQREREREIHTPDSRRYLGRSSIFWPQSGNHLTTFFLLLSFFFFWGGHIFKMRSNGVLRLESSTLFPSPLLQYGRTLARDQSARRGQMAECMLPTV